MCVCVCVCVCVHVLRSDHARLFPGRTGAQEEAASPGVARGKKTTAFPHKASITMKMEVRCTAFSLAPSFIVLHSNHRQMLHGVSMLVCAGSGRVATSPRNFNFTTMSFSPSTATNANDGSHGTCGVVPGA